MRTCLFLLCSDLRFIVVQPMPVYVAQYASRHKAINVRQSPKWTFRMHPLPDLQEGAQFELGLSFFGPCCSGLIQMITLMLADPVQVQQDDRNRVLRVVL